MSSKDATRPTAAKSPYNGGALYLVNAGGYEYGTALPLSISSASDVANLKSWTVYREGVAVYDGALAPSVRTEHMLDFVVPANLLFE